jgi:hypothetical protein
MMVSANGHGGVVKRNKASQILRKVRKTSDLMQDDIQGVPGRPAMPPGRSLQSYWTTPRLEIRAWFQRRAPSLGELYEGAVIMVFDDKFPGRTRLVAHAIREIRNRLPDVIAGPRASGQVQYVNRLDKIAHEWRRARLDTEGSLPAGVTDGQQMPSIDVPVPRGLFLSVASLLSDHLEAREKSIEAARRLFEAISPANQELRDRLRIPIQQWHEVTQWFVKRVHDSGIQDDDVDIQEFQGRFELFETALCALLRGFYSTVEGLDEILEDANSRAS